MHTCRPSSRLEEPLSGIEVAGAFGEGGGPRAADAGVSGARLIDRQPWTPSHLILFARGTCKQGSDCKFCHSLHVGRPASLDAQQRALIASWSLAKLLDAVLPHLKKATGVALHPGSAHLLELVQRELDLRKTTITTRMALAGEGFRWGGKQKILEHDFPPKNSGSPGSTGPGFSTMV
ncbi:unnamed protein product [Durusdinium trenchii]|uniref:C3H1-type domain-containing protein n=1 Tax=Durusdinium trenchii TaxID=1381693 RepID=A0ABP0IM15_9DINO